MCANRHQATEPTSLFAWQIWHRAECLDSNDVITVRGSFLKVASTTVKRPRKQVRTLRFNDGVDCSNDGRDYRRIRYPDAPDLAQRSIMAKTWHCRCTVAFRELYEETGITSAAVEVLQELKGWVHYDWPKKRQKEKRAMGATNWRGQRQVFLQCTDNSYMSILIYSCPCVAGQSQIRRFYFCVSSICQ